jgi:polysaccharide export outer membrane protein
MAAVALGVISSNAAEAQFLGHDGKQAVGATNLGQCLNGTASVPESELDKARPAAKSLMDDYWLLALVSDTADVTPAFQPAGSWKWVDGSVELTGDRLKRLRDSLARNPDFTMSSQPLSFAVSAAGSANRARGVWSVYALKDPSRIAGYYVVDFMQVANRWGISQIELVRPPAELPVARPFCVRPGDIEVAAAVRSGVDGTDSPLPKEAGVLAAIPRTDGAQVYRISQGDKIKITTFGEDRFSGEFLVHGDGKITFPLFGDIPAAGSTIPLLIASIKTRLTPDYLRDPQVTAEVISFRPVYVLGEVARPGQYSYTEGMTMYALIAQAGGFSYRANSKRAFVRHDGQSVEQRIDIQSSTPISPGDTIRIGQRIF